jgi:carboxyl-terminal processing protease
MTGSDEDRPVKPKDATVVGVGVLVTRNDDGKFEITRVFPNSPAEKAGLAKGLLLTKVGNVVTETKQRGELFKLLTGPVGSKVALQVSEKNGDNARTVEIIREQFLNRSGKTNADSETPAPN